MTGNAAPTFRPHPNPSPGAGEGQRFHTDNVPAARRLRKQLTPTEAILWERIRDRRCLNLKFRRQLPVGAYVLEFYCESIRVSIEIDGPVHLNPGQRLSDEIRQTHLEERGIRFIRIPTRLVAQDATELMHFLVETLSAQQGTPPVAGEGQG